MRGVLGQVLHQGLQQLLHQLQDLKLVGDGERQLVVLVVQAPRQGLGIHGRRLQLLHQLLVQLPGFGVLGVQQRGQGLEAPRQLLGQVVGQGLDGRRHGQLHGPGLIGGRLQGRVGIGGDDLLQPLPVAALYGGAQLVAQALLPRRLRRQQRVDVAQRALGKAGGAGLASRLFIKAGVVFRCGRQAVQRQLPQGFACQFGSGALGHGWAVVSECNALQCGMASARFTAR